MSFNPSETVFPPPLIWITGMPGSGKTTLANSLVLSLRTRGRPCIQLDGDELRRILNKENLDSDYSAESRLDLALLYSRLALSLNSQGYIVVVSTVSLFWKVQEFNRLNAKNYFEVFLNVDSILLQKGSRSTLYETNLRDQIKQEFPLKPDLILNARQLNDRSSWLSILEDSLLGKAL